MSNLKAKMKKEGGFTLIEMLIVVAIIAILIAVSIPLVNGALERARDATDQANERAAKAEALLYYMGTVTDAELAALQVTPPGGTTAAAYVPGNAFDAYYDAADGDLKAGFADVKEKYGKCTGKTDCYEKNITGRTVKTHVGCVIKVSVNGDGKITMEWVNS